MMKMQGNTTEIDERNLLRLDALLSHGYGLSPQLVMDGLSMTSITMTTMPVQTDLAQSSTG